MELKRIELESKQTVGYLEAKDKESFTIGVAVAFSKIEENYQKEIEDLKKVVLVYKSNYESVSSDLKTLSSIVNRYSDID